MIPGSSTYVIQIFLKHQEWLHPGERLSKEGGREGRKE